MEKLMGITLARRSKEGRKLATMWRLSRVERLHRYLPHIEDFAQHLHLQITLTTKFRSRPKTLIKSRSRHLSGCSKQPT
jgi:hypothetical protein